ncbi:hypothetical protein [Bathymodiolus platifrons methanotrophic gill symbiont]|uniref:hypothetical protein n=1 Tax=Bathymodiolus platifrons methanotrophic gill symbiont TaxID=113268 RepID=UPI001C8E31AB|nr:hypothetical protein [Bathymodiolus platifrons methanotrophic gill symbiont]
MGDALVALRPSQLRTKPCSVKTTSNGWTAIRNANSCLPRALLAHFGSVNCPVAYQGLKIITPLRLRFPDFKRMNFS